MSKMYTFTLWILEPDFRSITSHTEVMGLMTEMIPKFPLDTEFLFTLLMEHCLWAEYSRGAMRSKGLVNYTKKKKKKYKFCTCLHMV